jgi:hypothetical protein
MGSERNCTWGTGGIENEINASEKAFHLIRQMQGHYQITNLQWQRSHNIRTKLIEEFLRRRRSHFRLFWGTASSPWALADEEEIKSSFALPPT